MPLPVLGLAAAATVLTLIWAMRIWLALRTLHAALGVADWTLKQFQYPARAIFELSNALLEMGRLRPRGAWLLIRVSHRIFTWNVESCERVGAARTELIAWGYRALAAIEAWS